MRKGEVQSNQPSFWSARLLARENREGKHGQTVKPVKKKLKERIILLNLLFFLSELLGEFLLNSG